jgi:PPK2 family polyphosphate:nucleotide phosphotransferase
MQTFDQNGIIAGVKVGERWLVPPGETFDLGKFDPASTAGAPSDKTAAEALLAKMSDELFALQGRLWAENKQSLLVVLQAMDTGGKDGTIRHVFRGVNPQGVRVTPFKAPSEEERRHDFLWRAHRATPAAGEIGIFNRSHYEDVLVVRVHSLVPEEVWRPRYKAINDFERHLSRERTTMVKFWLHISPEEQKRRLQARLDDPTKRWKFDPLDLEERKLWRDYQAAAEEMLWRTSKSRAPWYVIPADHKWYRNWVVSTILIDTVKVMDPQYPAPTDLGTFEIPDV